MDFIYAFIVGGAICVVGQLLLDFAKLTPAHLMATFVVIGAILDSFGLYDKLIKFAGAGATVPITSFGHSLLHGALQAAEKHGYLGIGIGMFSLTSAGISAAILFAFFMALICKPKG
ncbi:stage V sporulation protein AE [Bacillus pseudomycoides]|uniref:Stage V sporulation protein AE n=1 Tax=Bacillus pseudomycoides TaxID=64104 RepID=A0AA91VBV0_9BACI|nr:MULTISPECIES: stage V sporulation protein AE [Bacillus]PEB53169.1 stage V sporulation protein AE [Bacillus sp. AFS098217]PED82237.1 stage V sporulation protein AE [Bacillus pseudomycoides]PEU13437.1 stage V sporulation protein AE [Bacillus sp. AFS014408]PEU14563.1 stage V sporulation protein AE [Bacillus sp. AFS019443]PFW61707.1 stage V sporulation protein AE [Bacillus sp. AFS075034]